MANIQIIQGNFEKKLKLQFAPGIKAGFPSPADDYSHETLDFNRDLIDQGDRSLISDTEGRIFCYIPSADSCGCLHFFDELFGGIKEMPYLCSVKD